MQNVILEVGKVNQQQSFKSESYIRLCSHGLKYIIKLIEKFGNVRLPHDTRANFNTKEFSEVTKLNSNGLGEKIRGELR